MTGCHMIHRPMVLDWCFSTRPALSTTSNSTVK